MNFGNIELINLRGFSTWAIDCKPHVRNQLKRVFPSIPQTRAQTLHLTNNPANCRELVWFLMRYPMTVPEMDRLVQGSNAHIAMETNVEDLLSSIRPPDDFQLAIPARDYQLVAATLLELKRGLLLGDKVGLGKSVSSICPMAKDRNLPALVTTLTHLPTQWEGYLNRFAPQLKVHILKTGKPYDLLAKPKRGQGTLFEDPRFPDVIVCNYHKLAGWVDVLKGVVKYCVWDEVQELRRTGSQKYEAAKEIASGAELNIGLSATPIYNYGDEFYNVIDVLTPGALGSRDEFLIEYCHDGKLKDPQAFGDYLRTEGMMLVRTRKDVGREIPLTQKIPHAIEASLEQLDKIQTKATELAKIILGSNQSYPGQQFVASGEFNVMMRQATGLAKATYVAEFARMLLETEEKIVIFGWHHEVYHIWEEALAEFNPVKYTGTETPKQKNASKEAFVNGDSRILIISLRAGAGLDGLQEVCRVCVFGELDWSAGVHEQCIGRLDREPESGVLDELGPVFAYYLLSEFGSDPIMADILGIKQAQIDGVIIEDPDQVEILETDPEHVKKLAVDYLARQGIKIEIEPEELLEMA